METRLRCFFAIYVVRDTLFLRDVSPVRTGLPRATWSPRQQRQYREGCGDLCTCTHRCHLWTGIFQSQHMPGVQRVCRSHTLLLPMQCGLWYQQTDLLNGPFCHWVGRWGCRNVENWKLWWALIWIVVIVQCWVGCLDKSSILNRNPTEKIKVKKIPFQSWHIFSAFFRINFSLSLCCVFLGVQTWSTLHFFFNVVNVASILFRSSKWLQDAELVTKLLLFPRVIFDNYKSQ